MISQISAREDQLTGKTMLIVGMGRIGGRLARLAKAFDMRVLATKRDPAQALKVPTPSMPTTGCWSCWGRPTSWSSPAR